MKTVVYSDNEIMIGTTEQRGGLHTRKPQPSGNLTATSSK